MTTAEATRRRTMPNLPIISGSFLGMRRDAGVPSHRAAGVGPQVDTVVGRRRLPLSPGRAKVSYTSYILWAVLSGVAARALRTRWDAGWRRNKAAPDGARRPSPDGRWA